MRVSHRSDNGIDRMPLSTMGNVENTARHTTIYSFTGIDIQELCFILVIRRHPALPESGW